jgi:hypothetical protein
LAITLKGYTMLWQFTSSSFRSWQILRTSRSFGKGKSTVEKDVIANELIEVKDMLEILAEQYGIPSLDPLWQDPMDRINRILEEIE